MALAGMAVATKGKHASWPATVVVLTSASNSVAIAFSFARLGNNFASIVHVCCSSLQSFTNLLSHHLFLTSSGLVSFCGILFVTAAAHVVVGTIAKD